MKRLVDWFRSVTRERQLKREMQEYSGGSKKMTPYNDGTQREVRRDEKGRIISDMRVNPQLRRFER